MITQRLQAVATIAGVFFLIVMVLLLRKNQIALKYALLWLFSGVVMLLLALFPGLLDSFARVLGVYDPVNALFAVLLMCGLLVMISLTGIVSRQKREIVRLAQELSLLENRVQTMESKQKEG